jgi:hypothetical protein
VFLAVGCNRSANDFCVLDAELGTRAPSRFGIVLRNAHDYVGARENFRPGTTVFGANLLKLSLMILGQVKDPLLNFLAPLFRREPADRSPHEKDRPTIDLYREAIGFRGTALYRRCMRVVALSSLACLLSEGAYAQGVHGRASKN